MANVFPNDREYTYNSMIQELNVIELSMRDGSVKKCQPVNLRVRGQMNLIQRHITDASIKICSCNPGKHLPTVTQLAIDGIKVSKTDGQRKFMENMRDTSLTYTERLAEGQLTEEEAVEMRKWTERNIALLKKHPEAFNDCGTGTDELLLTVSGFASEGIGFTDDKVEKKFMINTRDKALEYQKLVASGKVDAKKEEEIREWSREIRRRVVDKIWTGGLPKSARKDALPKRSKTSSRPTQKSQPTSVKVIKEEEDCPTCTVIPDKYNRPASVDDVRLVSMPESRKVTSMSQKVGGNDIRIIRMGY